MPSSRYRWVCWQANPLAAPVGGRGRYRPASSARGPAPAAANRARPPKRSLARTEVPRRVGGPANRLHWLRRRRELRAEPSGCSGGAARRGLSPRDHTRSRRNVPLRLGRLAAWRGGGVGRRTQHVRTQICAVRRWVGLLGPGFRVRAWVPRGCAVTREDRARIGRFVRERGSFPAGVAAPLQTSGRRRRAPRVNAWVFRGGVFVWAPECGAPLRRTPTHRLIALASSSNGHAAAIVALQGCYSRTVIYRLSKLPVLSNEPI